ncbi:MAG: N-glycosylase/DNA lyase [Thermosphaera sp.]
MIIDLERAREIGRMLKVFSHLTHVFERNDPQYRAVEKIVEAKGCSQAALIVLGNSLASYKLNVRGEEYWTALAEYISRSEGTPERALIRFLSDRRDLARLIDQKIRRIQAFFKSELSRELSVDGLGYCSRLNALRNELAASLNTSRNSKTILFAVKMYYYLCSACGRDTGEDIDLPIDSRNSRLSLWSCIVRGCHGGLDVCAEKLMRDPYRGELVQAWRIVCKESGIPCVKLDSVTWLLTGVLADSGLNPEVAKSKIFEKFNIELPLKVVEEFLKCTGDSE